MELPCTEAVLSGWNPKMFLKHVEVLPCLQEVGCVGFLRFPSPQQPLWASPKVALVD